MESGASLKWHAGRKILDGSQESEDLGSNYGSTSDFHGEPLICSKLQIPHRCNGVNALFPVVAG